MERMATYWSDVRTFGLGALWQEAGRFRKDSRVRLRLRGLGTIAVRSGDSDMSCLRQVFTDQQYRLGGLFEKRTRAAYNRILAERKIPVIIDAGANIGAASLWFSRTYPDAVIVAVEPDAENFRLLKENVAQSNKVRPLLAAIGGTNGHVKITKPDNCSAACRTERADEGVEMLTIADVTALVPNGRLFVVKIDIEGGEKDVFEHSAEWINDAHVIIVEPHDWMLPKAGTSQSFLRALSAHDFDLLIMHENLAFVR